MAKVVCKQTGQIVTRLRQESQGIGHHFICRLQKYPKWAPQIYNVWSHCGRLSPAKIKSKSHKINS